MRRSAELRSLTGFGEVDEFIILFRSVCEELCRDDLAKVIQQSLDQLLSFLRSREFPLFDTGNWGAFLGGARGTKRSKLGGNE